MNVPTVLKSSRKLTYEDALSAPTREALIQELARREMLEVTHQGVDKQLAHFSAAYHIDVASLSGVPELTLVRVMEQRNLFVHNNGIVTKEYERKASDGRPVGHRLILDDGELNRNLTALQKTAESLVDGCLRKFGPRAEVPVVPKSQDTGNE